MSKEYSLAQDLKETQAFVESLDSYLQQDQLYGSVGGGFFTGGRMPALTVGSLKEIASRLPARPPRRKLVELEEAASVSTPAAPPDSDRVRTSATLSAIVQRFLAQLPSDDRLMLQLRFDSGMTVAGIARSLDEDQKAMYRRMERRLREMRTALEDAGIAAEDARDLIGDQGVVLDFQLGTGLARPSTQADERHERTSG